ncbi:hypothetical protein DYB32_000909 [Aphanomyces invadans]|uniref:Uncharacterized protein n=1 Tax=Aphanomyces invadans TaxID=157072 RepID=A0A418B8K8_9STRA|nr:hypothetical protein DYB32_000909 [Aphanomyces invadans]
MYHSRDVDGQDSASTLPLAANDEPVKTLDAKWHAQLQRLVEDIASKQAFIDKVRLSLQMQKEMDKRTTAIKSCGVEIVDLRKHLQKKDQLIQSLQVKLHNYEALEQRQQEMQYKTLEAAHLAQANFIQKANAEMQKLTVYKQTIATQETVIAKLEKLVESKLAEAKASAVGPNVHTTSRFVVHQPDNKPALDVSTNTDAVAVPSPDEDKSYNEDVLWVKIRVLEDQLRINTTAAAQEIATLKARVFELEVEADASR